MRIKRSTYSDNVLLRRTARSSRPAPERRVTCRACNGAGQVTRRFTSDREICTNCNGAGQVFA